MIRNNSALYVSLINLIGLEMLPNRFKEKCCVNIDPTVIRLCNDNNFFFFIKILSRFTGSGRVLEPFLEHIFMYIFLRRRKRTDMTIVSDLRN